ncbi:hypothetical protein [Sphingosinicella sp.]|uniref:hypothetical protein n=1 Tax=Sphingosinicella sp. TaxID=1917971 RepID=UPI004037C23B
MRKAHLSVMALAALVTFVAGSSMIAAQPRAPAATAPLLPLSERDLSATGESGCECSFNSGRGTLMRVIGNELTLSTRAGRQVCRISDNEFSALSNGRANVACAGLRLSLRRTGRISSHPESDSADWPASLTVGQGRLSRTLAGRFGCAC